MAVEKHPDYRQELDRLNATLRDMDRIILSQIDKKAKVDQTVKSTMAHFDSADSENYITMIVERQIGIRSNGRILSGEIVA